MKTHKLLGLLAVVAFTASLLAPRTALAKDAVEATIENYGSNGFVIENGAFQTPGTYAIGTIKVNYMIPEHQFPADQTLKTFDLCLDVLVGKPKPPTVYPATVEIYQVGSPEVLLDLEYDNVVFDEDKAPNHPCVEVKVSVPAVIANDPAYQEDGTELVANLQLSTPSGTHLDTVTTVKVHLTLVHPSQTACIVPLHLVANNDINSNLSSTGIVLSVHVDNGLNTSQQGRHVVALVNTCSEAKTIDLNTALNEHFKLQSSAAVQTTNVNQEIADINQLLGVNWGSATWTNNGNALCLSGVSVPANQTFVVAEHISMKSSALHPGSSGPVGGQGLPDWFYGGFTYGAYTTGGACASSGTLSPDMDPNQGSVSIPINYIDYNGKDAPADEYPPAP